MMTIAQDIKEKHVYTENGAEFIADWDSLAFDCSDKSIDTNQDWENETTEFQFEDGSKLLWCGNELRTIDPWEDDQQEWEEGYMDKLDRLYPQSMDQ